MPISGMILRCMNAAKRISSMIAAAAVSCVRKQNVFAFVVTDPPIATLGAGKFRRLPAKATRLRDRPRAGCLRARCSCLRHGMPIYRSWRSEARQRPSARPPAEGPAVCREERGTRRERTANGVTPKSRSGSHRAETAGERWPMEAGTGGSCTVHPTVPRSPPWTRTP